MATFNTIKTNNIDGKDFLTVQFEDKSGKPTTYTLSVYKHTFEEAVEYIKGIGKDIYPMMSFVNGEFGEYVSVNPKLTSDTLLA